MKHLPKMERFVESEVIEQPAIHKDLGESESNQMSSAERVELIHSVFGDEEASMKVGVEGISGSVTARKVHRCQDCQYETTNKSHLTMHLLKHTGERPYQCDVCPASFSRSYHLKRHMTAHVGGLVQSQLETSYKTEAAQFDVSEERVLTEDITEELYPNVKLEVMDDQVHTDYNLERCSETERIREDGEDFDSAGTANEEEGNGRISPECQPTPTFVDGKKFYRCQHCWYNTADASHMRYHLRKHSGERPFKCEVCSKTFTTSHHLKRHTLVHTRVRRFKCELCPAGFGRADSLKAHSLLHSEGRTKPYMSTGRADCSQTGGATEDGRFSCVKCSFSCGPPQELRAHIKAAHPEARPFSCESCSFSCIRAGDLRRHEAKHTGQRPFQCDLCEFWCSEQRYLKKHMVTHRVEPLYCDLCNYQSAHRRNMILHSRTHTGERPFGCAHCEFRAAGKSDLVRHISRRHCF